MTMMNPSAPRAASVPGGRTPPPNAATSQRTLTVVDRGGSSGTANRPGNNSGKVGGVAVSSGRYVNAILSILNHPTVVAPKNDKSTVSSSERRHERKRQCIQTLDRLVPPLFYYSRNNYCDLDGGEDALENKDESNNTKKRKRSESTEDDEHDAAHPPDGISKTASTTGETNQCSSRNENHNLTNSSYLATLRQQLSHYKLQNQRLCDRRMSVFHLLVELHECYETGLDGIARLNDLRYVPDNVMMDRPSSKS
ncbi:hypothetical protein HJC23_009182 [Cyclotella cryptica]|uniref:Uncharacterized protein n=1 Tax=Cyclotella cryptica TaxID=29204 RepID=A0ABD3PM95_9STRA